MINFWTKLPKPFTVLAPMEGVTDFAFREIVATNLSKPDVIFTEFTNVDALNSDGFEKTILRFRFSKAQKPIVAQIWGIDPENFYKSAQLINKLGFDGIDINMGCPDKAVTKIGAGAYLINNYPLVEKIIKAVKKGAGGLPISVKTRIGIKDIVTNDWITFLLKQKLEAITVHGRTAKELSKKDSHWDEIGKSVKIKNLMSPETIIIGNGDVKSMDGVKEKSEKYGVDGVMIGRGIFLDPWVFDKSHRKRSSQEYISVLVKHLSLLDDGQHYDTVKKFFKMYINNFKGAVKLRMKLMDTKNVSEALKILNVL